MMTFPLYKNRDFGEYISDTFLFFKKYWKNFFLTFITINGALLLLLCFIFYYFFKDLFSNILANPTEVSSLFLSENSGLYIIMFIVAFLAVIIITIFTTAFPIAYMQLIEETDKETFTAGEIFEKIKDKIGRILLFGLWSLIIFLPIVLVFSTLSILLIIIIIGIPIFIVGLSAIMVWMYQTLFVYLNEDVGFFDAFQEGWKTLFSKFLHVVGASMVVYIIITVISGILSYIPMILFISKDLANLGTPESVKGFTGVTLAIYIIQIVTNYFFMNVLYVNQGFIYYSNKEKTENIQSFSEIDNIGKHED